MLVCWHFAHLFGRSWSAFTSSLSTSTLGLIVQIAVIPLVLLGLTLAAAFYREGKQGALKHLNKTLLQGALFTVTAYVLVYGAILSWKLIQETYEDHQRLVATIKRLDGDLTAKQKPVEEPSNSLRRRVIRLTDELESFTQERNEKMPGYTTTAAMTPEEQQRAMKPQQIYEQQTTDLYKVRFSRQTVGIIRELKTKGLPVTPYYEQAASMRMLLPGEVDHLRDLAHYLDERGNVIWIDGK